MRRYFQCVSKDDGSNWLVASLGRDSETNQEQYLTTYFVHASEVGEITDGARNDGRLIADLLNWYHNSRSAPGTINAFTRQLNIVCPLQPRAGE